MSAPAPDWMAAVMRGCRSLALMVSSTHLGAEGLGGLRHLALQLDVGLGDEVHPAHPVQLGALGEGGRPARGQDALDAARDRGGRAGGLDEGAADRPASRSGARVLSTEIGHDGVLLDWWKADGDADPRGALGPRVVAAGLW